MDTLFSSSIWNPLAWALIHFLWQGAVVAGSAAIALILLRGHDARLRYGVALGALVIAAVMPILTLCTLRGQTPAFPTGAWTALPSTDSGGLLRWVVWSWFAGMLVLGTRNLRAWNTVRGWVRDASPLDPQLATRFERLCDRLRMQTAVRLVVSARIDAPAALGWIRPVVLIPVGSLTGLSAAQLDAVLAHELAHIRRHDYLVNLFQIGVETVLFYHPGVWWISRQIRIERENCCDDVAVALCGDARLYLQALTGLESVRSQTPNLSLSLQGGSLMDRVRRLLAPSTSQRPGPAALIAVGLLLVSLLTGVYACDSTNTTTPEPATLKSDSGQIADGSQVNLTFESADGEKAFSGTVTVNEDGSYTVNTPDGEELIWMSGEGAPEGSGVAHFVHKYDENSEMAAQLKKTSEHLVASGLVTQAELDALHAMHTEDAPTTTIEKERAMQIMKMIHKEMAREGGENVFFLEKQKP